VQREGGLVGKDKGEGEPVRVTSNQPMSWCNMAERYAARMRCPLMAAM
jgi:hypothetical protein